MTTDCPRHLSVVQGDPQAGFPAAAVALGFAMIGCLLVLFGIVVGFVIGHWLV